MPALVGGGAGARPGEISLAHHGVLFLDELPEFQAQALDALRQPLETGEVAISRANRRTVYPARFQLIAAMNPCRCGHALEPGYSCRRGEPRRCAQTYQTRLSGPLLDRIDLHLEVPAVRASDLILPAPSEGSAEVAARVAAARDIQRHRFLKFDRPEISCNAAAPAALVEQIVQLDEPGMRLVRDASEKLRLSARGFHRVLKLARTIADLQGSDSVRRAHLAEALSYRAPSDRGEIAA
jgi:magnesium chelatase family protein